ncbi:hypothetical protein AVEN_57113-1 [Araneus ventricosus]|uniref:Uncharacterized protein n=1 Tax=Araneus ventricosus TaxID=182803 RepID=A0A4Y2SR08_ARAVE|nr:hypothetical protein AVEN_57113-1 [Araneus ventricosus]
MGIAIFIPNSWLMTRVTSFECSSCRRVVVEKNLLLKLLRNGGVSSGVVSQPTVKLWFITEYPRVAPKRGNNITKPTRIPDLFKIEMDLRLESTGPF